MSTTRATTRTSRRPAAWGAAGLLAAVTLAGCGSAVVASGGGADSGSSPASTGSSGSSGTTTTPAPTPTSSSPGGSSTAPGGTGPGGGIATVPITPVRSGPASVVGTVKDGVEPRCLLVGPYVLTGTESLPQAEQDLLTTGATVAVTGTVDPGMASYCQQGTLLAVTSVHAVRPMGPGPKATPTVYSTP